LLHGPFAAMSESMGLLRPCACLCCTGFLLCLLGVLMPDDGRPITVLQMDASEIVTKTDVAKTITPSPPKVISQPASKAPGLPESPIEPHVSRVKVLKRYAHDPGAFTQGLLYLGSDTLYESNGLYGKSNIRRIDLATGKVLASTMNQKSDFGEGLTYYKGYLWQVCWKTHKIFKYDPETLERLAEYSTPHEFDHTDGWGLATISDGASELYKQGDIPQNEKLFITDSGTKLYQIEFEHDAFKLISSVTIAMPNGEPLEMANELELISENELWANIYGQYCIAQINPSTGKVFGWILADNLAPEKGPRANVFNGIAIDRKKGRIFVTGKQWSTLFEVELVPEVVSAQELKRVCVPKDNIFHPKGRGAR